MPTPTDDVTTDGASTDTDVKPEAVTADAKPDSKKDETSEVEKWKALARKNEAQARANAAAAKKLEDLEAAQKSDLDREKDRATKAEERAVKAEALAAQRAIRSAVIDAAAKAGALNPADVLAVLATDAVTVNDDGSVEGAEEAVAEALAARPFWKAATTPQGSADQGARGGKPIDFKTASPDELAAELRKYDMRPRST